MKKYGSRKLFSFGVVVFLLRWQFLWQFISLLRKTRLKFALVADELFNDLLFQVKIVKEVKKRTGPEALQKGMKERNKHSRTEKKGTFKDSSNLE